MVVWWSGRLTAVRAAVAVRVLWRRERVVVTGVGGGGGESGGGREGGVAVAIMVVVAERVAVAWRVEREGGGG